MKILVAFKAVFDPDGWEPGVPASDATRIINPFDAIAIEEAMRFRERGDASSVVAVTIGAPRVEEQVHTSMAMGVDRAVRIDDDRPIDPYVVSRLLAAMVGREQPAIVLMGKQAIDDDSSQTGQMLAALLGWPQATFVSKIELGENSSHAHCTRETDAGLEVVSVRLPAVITTDLRLNEPRHVSLAGLTRARRKPIECLTCDDLGVDVQPMTTLLSTEPLAARPPGTMVDSVEQLMSKLRDEVEVL